MHFIDLAVTNTWIQYRWDEVKKATPRTDIMQSFDFRMNIVRYSLHSKPFCADPPIFQLMRFTLHVVSSLRTVHCVYHTT